MLFIVDVYAKEHIFWHNSKSGHGGLALFFRGAYVVSMPFHHSADLHSCRWCRGNSLCFLRFTKALHLHGLIHTSLPIDGNVRCIDFGVFWQSEFYERIVLALAKKNADGWFLKILFHETVIVVDVHLHLTEILMGEVIHFQVNKDIALKQSVVEHNVNIEMSFLESESLLSCLKEETLAHFEEEVL